ncbi:MAG: hypothetical protein ACYS99_06515, partial [Planctomycetota bacterium]|jgi:lipopolysaccharide export system protein LptA
VPEGSTSRKKEWEIWLSDGVRVLSREEGRVSRLLAEDATCFPAERRVTSRGRVELSSDEFVIRGEDLEGDAALATFTVRRDIEVILPTSVLLGEEATDGPRETRITAAGPLLVERREDVEKGRPIPTRVDLANGVEVLQEGESPGYQQRLTAQTLQLDLVVRPSATANGSQRPVTVTEVRADGAVELLSGTTTRARAERLTVTRTDEEQRAVMSGNPSLHHEGPLAPAGEGGEPGSLDVRAGTSATWTRTAATGADRTVFTGGVHARRETEGGDILTLDARTLTLDRHPEKGASILAEGDARFATGETEGRADRIRWHREGETKSVLRLEGSPRAELLAGAGFEPFGTAPTRDAPAGDAQAKFVLSCRDSMVLTKSGAARNFSMAGGCVTRKLVDDVETFRVTAERMEAALEGEEVKSLGADGSVVAWGRDEAGGTGRYAGKGESFRFVEDQGKASFVGSPSEARFAETEDRENVVRAARLTFDRSSREVTAEDGVRATVHLAERPGAETHAYTLSCDRLVVVPAAKKPDAGKGVAGRIESLTATGRVVLEGAGQTATGEKLTYGVEEEGLLLLSGDPAVVTREQVLRGTRHRDTFSSRVFRLKLAGREIRSFTCPKGGSFILHRISGAMPGVAAEPRDEKDDAPVERLSGTCEGPFSFDGSTVRMTDGAKLMQAIWKEGRFEKVSRFEAKEVEAALEKLEDGRLRLVRAEGRGNVHGSGENWELWCERFEVDLLKHTTTVHGTPARVRAGGRDQLVERAVYDYEKDEWRELFRTRPR